MLAGSSFVFRRKAKVITQHCGFDITAGEVQRSLGCKSTGKSIEQGATSLVLTFVRLVVDSEKDVAGVSTAQ